MSEAEQRWPPRPNPKISVGEGCQANNGANGLRGVRVVDDTKTLAVKAYQSLFRPNPEVPIFGLSDCVDRPRRKPTVASPSIPDLSRERSACLVAKTQCGQCN